MGAAGRAAALGGFPRITVRQAGLVCFIELGLLALGWKLGGILWPLAAALAALFAVVAYRSPDTAWLLTWAATPLSVEMLLPGGSAVAMPTEPMMVIALGAWLAREWPWRHLNRGPKSIARPLTILAGVALFSVFTSGFLAIGLKAWIVAALYAAFGYLYFVSTGGDVRRVMRFLALGAALGCFVSIYASSRALANGAGVRASYGAARPFFPEHGTYAAYLAFLLPPVILECIASRRRHRPLWAAAVGLLLVGVVFSYTRAAWLSLLIVLPLCLLSWLGTRGSTRRLLLPVSLVAFLGVGIVGSGTATRLWRHAQSSFDAENVSNLERLNRWLAAVEMTKSHPWTGVGYSAYGESYRDYRRKVVVTDQVYGHFGAHNELLRILAETGWAGLGAALWFVAAVAYLGIRSFARAPLSDRGRIAFGLTCGLATYAIHGLFNSYLGMDKVSIPFWVFIGMIAATATNVAREAQSRSGRHD